MHEILRLLHYGTHPYNTATYAAILDEGVSLPVLPALAMLLRRTGREWEAAQMQVLDICGDVLLLDVERSRRSPDTATGSTSDLTLQVLQLHSIVLPVVVFKLVSPGPAGRDLPEY